MQQSSYTPSSVACVGVCQLCTCTACVSLHVLGSTTLCMYVAVCRRLRLYLAGVGGRRRRQGLGRVGQDAVQLGVGRRRRRRRLARRVGGLGGARLALRRPPQARGCSEAHIRAHAAARTRHRKRMQLEPGRHCSKRTALETTPVSHVATAPTSNKQTNKQTKVKANVGNVKKQHTELYTLYFLDLERELYSCDFICTA